MDRFYLGNTIRQLRKKKKMTLEDLADGICSKRQLQRIETNTTIPSAHMLTLISKKLNEDVSTYFPYSEYENPMEIHDLIIDLESTLALRDYEKLYQISLPYFKIITSLPIDLQQKLAYYHGSSLAAISVAEVKEFTPEDYLHFLKLTLTFDTTEDLCLSFKTMIEYRLTFSYIMVTYFANVFPNNANEHLENINKGIHYLNLLIHSYLDNHLTLDTDFLGRVYNNIAHAYCLIENYHEALHYINKALEPSYYPKSLSVIAMLYYIKGNIYIHFDEIEEAKKFYKYFIMLFDILGDNDSMMPLINYLRQTYDL